MPCDSWRRGCGRSLSIASNWLLPSAPRQVEAAELRTSDHRQCDRRSGASRLARRGVPAVPLRRVPRSGVSTPHRLSNCRSRSSSVGATSSVSSASRQAPPNRAYSATSAKGDFGGSAWRRASRAGWPASIKNPTPPQAVTATAVTRPAHRWTCRSFADGLLRWMTEDTRVSVAVCFQNV
jgi:hypothetical protein